jgi:hypothetical protein
MSAIWCEPTVHRHRMLLEARIAATQIAIVRLRSLNNELRESALFECEPTHVEGI